MKAELPIYLDYNATTPVAPDVLSAMLPYLVKHFGNPSSLHLYGINARQAVEQAQQAIATFLGAHVDEIIFTGSATEANNLALLGTASMAPADKRHLIVSMIEHPAVMAPAEHLKTLGWEITKLPVDEYGRISTAELRRALRADTYMISLMHANNEVGTLQPLAEVAALASEYGVLLHTDAAQSAGKIKLNVDDLGVDLLTLAGHKFYAPKGIGALYVRRGTPISGLLYGAEQAQGIRPGTENVPYIVALGAAAELATQQGDEAVQRMKILRDRLHSRLAKGVPGLVLNGHPELRLANTLHVSFPHVAGRELLTQAREVAASVGSACHSDTTLVSGVLAAMGLSAGRARGAIRLSVGWMTSEQEIDSAADALISAWRSLT